MEALVTVIGDLVEDVVVWTTGDLRLGTDNPSTVHRSRGGSGANVAVAAAEAGVRSRFIGCVGDDASGDVLTRGLAGHGVETRVRRIGRTGCVVVVVHPDGERTMFPDRAAAGRLGPVDPEHLADTTVLHLPLYGFLEPDAATHLIDAAAVAAADGAAISLDLSATSAIDALGIDRVRDLVIRLQPTFVFANRDESRRMGLASGPLLAVGTYVLKDGGAPTTLRAADGATSRIAPPAPGAVRDTTGAGDAFAGAFLADWATSRDVAAACAAGHVAAGRTLGLAGATLQPPAHAPGGTR